MQSQLPIIDMNGAMSWFDDRRRLHREDGPAVIQQDGTEMWYQHGHLHRDGAPAVIYLDGEIQYYQNDRLHRDDGPAAIGDGSQEWYRNGWRHRVDGPAVIKHGNRQWYVHGKCIHSPDEFKRFSGLSEEDILLLILKYGDIK